MYKIKLVKGGIKLNAGVPHVKELEPLGVYYYGIDVAGLDSDNTVFKNYEQEKKYAISYTAELKEYLGMPLSIWEKVKLYIARLKKLVCK